MMQDACVPCLRACLLHPKKKDKPPLDQHLVHELFCDVRMPKIASKSHVIATGSLPKLEPVVPIRFEKWLPQKHVY